MHFRCGNIHGFQCVRQRYACVRVAAGIDDDSVVMFEICALNFVDQGAFVVAPAENYLDFMAFGIVFQRFYQLFVRGFAVYVRFRFFAAVVFGFDFLRVCYCFSFFKLFRAFAGMSSYN